MRKPLRLSALFAALVLALSLAAPAAAAFYEVFPHPDTPFSEMDASPIDTAAIDAFCKRFVRDPIDEYAALLDWYDTIDTKLTLAAIESDRNAGDAAAGLAYESVCNDYDYASDRLCLALSEALSSEHGDALRSLMPEGEADAFAGYEPAGEDGLGVSAEESALLREYYLLPDNDGFADKAAELYLRLAALRRQEARYAGFDSYPEYAYIVRFAREYTPGDSAQLRRVVKERLAPLYVKCALALTEHQRPWDDEALPSDAEILDAIAAGLDDISPELNEAMDFLRRNGLYCIGSGSELRDTGYTDTLPAYRSAFLFNKVSARYDAFETTVHEFGHFNAAYHDPTPALYQYANMDVSEIQSQGLELLFIPALQDILAGEDSDGRACVALSVVTDILQSVIDGCLYDEFEQTVYADPSLTAQDLHALEARLNAEYGLDSLYDPEPFWPYVSHLFEQPCYYISYATSALPALDIWLMSLNDRSAAADVYMRVSAARTDEWFLDVLYDNGLCDVTDAGDVRRLADALEPQLDELLGELPAPPFRAAVWGGVWIAAGAAVILCTALILRRRRHRIQTESEMEPAHALRNAEKTE